MQSTRKTYALATFVGTLALLCGGCATGPQYTYAQQKDSARIVGPGVPIRASESSTCGIIVKEVDGLALNFPASSANAPSWLYSKTPLYLAPGKHVIALDITEIDMVLGATEPHKAGAYGDTISYGSRPAILWEFIANHVYRITASVHGSSVDVTLWDETDDRTAPVRVENWTFASNPAYHR